MSHKRRYHFSGMRQLGWPHSPGDTFDKKAYLTPCVSCDFFGLVIIILLAMDFGTLVNADNYLCFQSGT